MTGDGRCAGPERIEASYGRFEFAARRSRRETDKLRQRNDRPFTAQRAAQQTKVMQMARSLCCPPPGGFCPSVRGR
jgi:hypothetical protein